MKDGNEIVAAAQPQDASREFLARRGGGLGRALIDGAFGESASRSYGLTEAPPRQPDDLLAFSANVVNLMKKEPRTDTDVFGNPIDSGKLADSIEETRSQLSSALSDVDAWSGDHPGLPSYWLAGINAGFVHARRR